jgi:uncharacterized protein (TIGR02246 family)
MIHQLFSKRPPYFKAIWPAITALRLAVLIACPAGSTATAADLPGESAIRTTAEEFTKAFDRGDAKAVAALWTAGGTETDEQGAVFTGREAIEAQYAALFKARPNARIKITIQSIELPTPGVAIEDGIASITPKEGEAAPASRYRAVHILENGKWLMTSVRELPIGETGKSPQLSQLAWLIGKWEAKSGDATATSDIRGIANNTFIQRDYVNRSGEKIVSSGTQIIGWDRQLGQLRSWSFDSSGGHGTGLWSAAPDGWQIESTGVLSDGTRTSSRDFLIRVPGEDNVFGWRSSERRAGQSTLPDTQEFVLDRVPDKR